MGKRKRQAGFTLIEMMIVVSIIITATALAAPAVRSALIDRRAAQATLDVVRIGRNARAEAIAYGRAYLLSFTSASNGTIASYRGVYPGCNQNQMFNDLTGAGNVADGTWSNVLGTAPTTASCINNSSCVDIVEMNGPKYSRGGEKTVLTMTGNGFMQICFQPDGDTYWRNALLSRFTNANGIPGSGGAFVFNIAQQLNGSQAGLMRRVVYPLGGTPRVLR